MPAEDRRRWQRVGREAVLRAREGHLRVSADRSPALIIHFTPGTTAADRDRLVALLADYDLVAIQEDDLGSPLTWTAHFGSAEARSAAAEAIGAIADGDSLRLELPEIEDDDWARRTQADLPGDPRRPGHRGAAMGPAPRLRPPGRPGRSRSSPRADSAPGTINPRGCVSCFFRPGGSSQDRARRGHRIGRPGDRGGEARRRVRVGDRRGSGCHRERAREHRAERCRADRRGARSRPDATRHAPGRSRHGQPDRHPPRSPCGRARALWSSRWQPDRRGFTVDEKPLVLDAFDAAFALTESAEEDGWWAVVLTRK